MYKIFKGFNCRTVKGNNLEIRSRTILKSYVLNPSRGSITLVFPDMTVEVEDDFDIKEHIIPMAEEDIYEQQKDRTYREGVTKNYGFVDNLDKVIEDSKVEANYNKRINIAAVLNYFHNIIKSEDVMDERVFDWIKSETERLKDEMKRLDILTASDEDIIQTALMEYSNQERYNNDVEIANKIDEVRKRFLDNKTEKFVKTNLNYHIKVKLNDYGKQIHHDYWKDICRDANVSYKLEVDEEGYSSFQIHDFMHIFGPQATLAAKPFLETTDVLVERRDK